ncbi:MAG: stage 0 sporulation family protein [Anaerolineales bacterium]|nr:stage 0 sporulation family protein [Anaerolineales bacterium]
MPKIVGIRFKPVSKIYYFDPTGFGDLEVRDYVIVETARGREAGQVAIAPKEVSEDEVVGKLKGIVRRAEPWDLVQMEHYRCLEHKALETGKEKAAEYGLPMKMIKAEYNFDGSLLVFYFAAEKRVDFRDLVRDLAKTFKAKIELKQVGVRDEAKLIGGLGRCGRPLCCASYLCEFNPVSIKMAKQQNLPLSPAEISGRCGRLLCCLTYENEYYVEMKKKLPRVGEKVDTQYGLGKVTGVNVIKETVNVKLESKVTVEVPAQSVKDQGKAAKGKRRQDRS